MNGHCAHAALTGIDGPSDRSPHFSSWLFPPRRDQWILSDHRRGQETSPRRTATRLRYCHLALEGLGQRGRCGDTLTGGPWLQQQAHGRTSRCYDNGDTVAVGPVAVLEAAGETGRPRGKVLAHRTQHPRGMGFVFK